MAGEALALADGLMLHPLAKGLLGLVMTGKTEIAALLLEQALEFGDMGAMALGALTLGYGCMDTLAAEGLLGMATDAARGGPSAMMRNPQHESCCQQYYKTNPH